MTGKNKAPLIALVDGSNYLYRAFYAIPALTNSKGFPTNAIYGFTNMLLKLLRELKPDYIVIAFVVKGPTTRAMKNLPIIKQPANQCPMICVRRYRLLKILSAVNIFNKRYLRTQIIGHWFAGCFIIGKFFMARVVGPLTTKAITI